MVAQTNYQVKYSRKINLTRQFVYEWGKPPRRKPHRVNLRSPLLRIHYYHNKWLQVKESQYLILTYDWTLTLIHNWTCSVVTISPFQCMAPSTWLTNWCTDPSTWLTHQLEKNVGCKFFSLSTRWRSKSSLVTKPYGIQMQQLLQEKDELGHMSSVTICLNKTFALSFINLHPMWRPLK